MCVFKKLFSNVQFQFYNRQPNEHLHSHIFQYIFIICLIWGLIQQKLTHNFTHLYDTFSAPVHETNLQWFGTVMNRCLDIHLQIMHVQDVVKEMVKSWTIHASYICIRVGPSK